jgi:hypothetical protein
VLRHHNIETIGDQYLTVMKDLVRRGCGRQQRLAREATLES